MTNPEKFCCGCSKPTTELEGHGSNGQKIIVKVCASCKELPFLKRFREKSK